MLKFDSANTFTFAFTGSEGKLIGHGTVATVEPDHRTPEQEEAVVRRKMADLAAEFLLAHQGGPGCSPALSDLGA
jgi:hypothetical protein